MTGNTPHPSLVVPDLLQGHWSAALILTYGADLGFFEARLAGQLAKVPLRIVISDGRRLREKLAEAATTGQRLRMANRSYLAAPLHHPRAAHAKTILLLGPREGLLVVGSGNLGHDGYASPGELWHVYRYHDDHPEHLNEFAASRALVDGLAIRGLLDQPTTDILRTLWGTAPWLPDAPAGTSAVRHNLDRPLIEQLIEAVDWPVRELIVHAPFHDPGCVALETLLRRFAPQRLRVLVSRATSVDAARLDAVLTKAPKPTLEVVEVAADPTTYVHAKWVHVKGDKTEALLTGSANLSQSALLRTAADGNVEAGVISIAGKEGFAALYDHLHVNKASDAAALGLTYTSGNDQRETSVHPVVMWTRLDGNRLTIMFDRPVDDTLELRISGFNLDLTWKVKRIDGATVELALDSESAATATEGGALTIHVGTDPDGEPNYSWPYQLAAIRGRLNKAGGRDQLHHIGNLPDRDADLYALLQELESSLVFDPISTWRVAKPDTPPPSGEDAGSLQWSQLDWSRVRRDPRFTGYLTHSRSLGTAPTDIQVILAAIAGRLGDLGLDSDEGGAAAGDESDLATEGTQETSEDADEQENELDDEVLRRTLTVTTRTRMAFSRFIKRYTMAARDRGFIEELGPIVTAKNAAIFSHLLSRLIERDAVDPERAAEAQLAVWRLLWGSPDGGGLLASIEPDERPLVDQILTEAGVRPTTIRAIARTSSLSLSAAARRSVRDQLRHLVVNDHFEFDADLVIAAVAKRELAAPLITELIDVAANSEPRELLDLVLMPLGLTSQDADWREQNVRRAFAGRHSEYRADVLEVRAHVANLSHDDARRALERLAIASHLGAIDNSYLRIRFAGNRSDVAYWDHESGCGVIMVQGDDRDIYDLSPPWPSWLTKLARVAKALGAIQATEVA